MIRQTKTTLGEKRICLLRIETKARTDVETFKDHSLLACSQAHTQPLFLYNPGHLSKDIGIHSVNYQSKKYSKGHTPGRSDGGNPLTEVPSS